MLAELQELRDDKLCIAAWRMPDIATPWYR